MRRPIDFALGAPQGIVDALGSSREFPAVEEVLTAVASFERIGFDVPPTATPADSSFSTAK